MPFVQEHTNGYPYGWTVCCEKTGSLKQRFTRAYWLKIAPALPEATTDGALICYINVACIFDVFAIHGGRMSSEGTTAWMQGLEQIRR